MDTIYVLKELFKAAKKCRKAQKGYYMCREPMNSPMKQSHLADAKRREQDLDKFIAQLPTLVPEIRVVDHEV